VGDLKKDYHCIVPDMPIGSHKEPMNPSADLTPTGLADILKGVVDSLELKEAPTIVGNGILQVHQHCDCIGDTMDHKEPKETLALCDPLSPIQSQSLATSPYSFTICLPFEIQEERSPKYS
jgi:hypothetical protein